MEQDIAPTYYAKGDKENFSAAWVALMKESVKHIAPFFNTNRMVKEYYERFYVPAHNYGFGLNEPGKVQAVADWRKQIADNWFRVSIKDVTSAPQEAILMGDKVHFKAHVSLGNLKPEEVQVEAFLGRRGNVGGLEKLATIPMNCTGKDGETYIYEADVAPQNSGRQDYALRVLPKNDSLPSVLTPLFIRWEE